MPVPRGPKPLAPTATCSRGDVRDALVVLRAARRVAPLSGPNFAGEAAEEHLTKVVGALDAREDRFVVRCLEQSFTALVAGDEREAHPCWAIVAGMAARDCQGGDEVLRGLAMNNAPQWLAGDILGKLKQWDAPRFAAIFRVASKRPEGWVRSWAAEGLIASGRASPDETDAFLCDPDDGVQRLAARGLCALATPDAIARLAERAHFADCRKMRHQANCLLRCLQLAPGEGGSA